MSSPRPPGWYDEPSGDRGLLRWWDGQSWTSVTRRRSPAEEAAPQPAADFLSGGGTGPADLLDSAQPRPASSRRRLAGAGIAGVLAVIVLLAVLPGRGADPDEGLADPRPVPTTTVPAPDPVPAPTTPRPVTGRVTDRVARLAYDVLPGDWREWDRDSFRGLESTSGYYRITQDSVPNGQTYWANVTSGQVDPAIAVGALPEAGAALVETLARSYYPEHRRDGLTRQALTVDGAPAYLIRYTAVFDPRSAAGYSAKSEAVTVLLVDTGDELPSALYVSLPDTVRELWPSVEPLLASVRIFR